MRTLPWVKGVHETYGPRGLAVIGIHTPEFARERKRENVEAEIKRHGLGYPNLLDDDMRYWRALDNEYWPSTYLVDKCGRIRRRHVGEVHAGERDARELEQGIESLLAEPATSCGT